MPSRFLVQTPLPIRWPFPVRTITRDVQIVETPAFKEDNWGFWNLRRTDEEALQRPHWMCIEAECEFHERHGMVDRMAEMLRTAMLGLQLWVPKGWSGIIVASQITGHVERVYIPEAYPDSRWGRMMDAAKLAPEELGHLVEGTLQAFETKSVPVVNPFEGAAVPSASIRSAHFRRRYRRALSRCARIQQYPRDASHPNRPHDRSTRGMIVQG